MMLWAQSSGLCFAGSALSLGAHIGASHSGTGRIVMSAKEGSWPAQLARE